MRIILSLFSVAIMPASGQTPARIPINREGSPRVEILFQNPQSGSLVPISMELLYSRIPSFVGHDNLRNLQSQGFARISDYTFQNYSRILYDPDMGLIWGVDARLNIRSDSRIVRAVGALGKLYNNISSSDSLVVGGSYDNDFVPFCVAESILTLPAMIESVAVAVALQTPAQSTITSESSPIISSLSLSFEPPARGKILLGLPESFIVNISAPLYGAGAIHEGPVAHGTYHGASRFSNCTPSISDHLPVIKYNLTRFVDDDTRISRLGHLAIHPSEYMDFVDDETRTCFMKIERYLAPRDANKAMLNVLAIPDMNLWITTDNVTICDAH